MASLQLENRVIVPTAKVLTVIAVTLYLSGASCALAQETQNNTSEQWTATTQTSVDSSPRRTTESHAKSGNRSMDQLSVEVLGPNGQYQPDYETEKETVQVNATTTRTVERTYRWDVNGLRNLVQVTEQEARSLAGGDAQVVRTTSSSDGNGNLQVVQREVADTTRKSPNAQETKTTLYLVDINGRLIPFLQTMALETQRDDHTIEVKKALLRQVSSGGEWEVGEIRKSTTQEDGKNRNSEQHVALFDLNGRLSEVSRTIGKETETAGEKSITAETYSEQLPGLAPDGRLHLNLRVTTVQKNDPGRETTEQQVEQTNPGDPSAGQQISKKTKYIVQYGAAGTLQTNTTQVRDLNGNLNVVSIETRRSDQILPAQVPTAPWDKAQ